MKITGREYILMIIISLILIIFSGFIYELEPKASTLFMFAAGITLGITVGSEYQK